MKTSILIKRTDIFVFSSLVVYAVYGVCSVFYSAFPLNYRSIILVIAGVASLASIVLPRMSAKWDGKVSKAICASLLLVGSLALSIFLQSIFLKDLIDSFGRSSLGYSRTIFFYGVCWFACGAVIQRLEIAESKIWSFAILIFLSTAIAVNLDGGFIISYTTLGEGRGDGMELNHLILGESVIFLLILSFSLAPPAWRILPFVLSLPILFSLGGRGALLNYILAIGFHLLLITRSRRLWPYIVLLAGFALLFGLNLFALDTNDSSISRMLLLEGVSVDGSAQTREIQFAAGFNALADQLLMGDPTFLTRTFGSMGTYMHNIFSAWQFFGFFPFAGFVFLMIWSGIYILRFRKIFDGVVSNFGVIIFLYGAFSILTTKSIGYYSFWFALGFWLFRLGSGRVPGGNARHCRQLNYSKN